MKTKWYSSSVLILLVIVGVYLGSACVTTNNTSNQGIPAPTPTQASSSSTTQAYVPINPNTLKSYLPPAPSGWKAYEEGAMPYGAEVDVAFAYRAYSLIANPQKTATVSLIAYPIPHRIMGTTNCTTTQIVGYPGFICEIRDPRTPTTWADVKKFSIKERIEVDCAVFKGQLSDVDPFVNAVDVNGLASLISTTSSMTNTNPPSSGQSSTVNTVGIDASGSGQYYKGEEVRFYGTCTMCDKVYLFLTGSGISSSGGPLTDPKRIAVNPTNPSTYTVVDVRSDSTFEFRWNTSKVDLDYGTYSLYATSSPLSAQNLNDANCPINVVKKMSNTNCAKMRFVLIEPFKVCCPNQPCWYSYEDSPPPKC